jgi:AraC-like ligand binding domain
MNAPNEIPSFGYTQEDFSSFPFVVEVKRIEESDRATRNFAHRHTYCHILWLTEGVGTHTIDFEAHPLSPDALFFIGPRQVHFWTSVVPVKGYSIKFSADFQQRLLTASNGLDKFPYFHPGSRSIHRIAAGGPPALFRRAAARVRERTPLASGNDGSVAQGDFAEAATPVAAERRDTTCSGTTQRRFGAPVPGCT